MAIMSNDPLFFTCSRCGASPHQPCRDNRGKATKPHANRARIYSRVPGPPPAEEPMFPPDNVTETANNKPDPPAKDDIGG